MEIFSLDMLKISALAPSHNLHMALFVYELIVLFACIYNTLFVTKFTGIFQNIHPIVNIQARVAVFRFEAQVLVDMMYQTLDVFL